jgi:xanthine dehydrogenase accessory factor
MQNILEFLTEKTQNGEKAALVTVTETTGSSPASPGQLMAVDESGAAVGTVGGGASEFRLIKQAAETIKSGIAVAPFEFDLNEEGMVCGGSMRGFINVLGNSASIAVFGGGHVAQKLAKAAVGAGFNVNIIEDRQELSEYFENVNYIVCEPEDYEKANVIGNCEYAVLCSRGHKTDAQALRYCLTKPLKYLGMIGSSIKTAAVFEQMKQAGISQEQLAQVYAPIGLNVASGIPAEIAVSILAEILLVKNNGTPTHKRND